MIFRCILISAILDETPEEQRADSCSLAPPCGHTVKLSNATRKNKSRFYCLMIRLVIHILVGVSDSNIVTSAKEVM